MGPPPPERRRVLGLPVSATDLDGAVRFLEDAVAAGRTTRVAVSNANKCWLSFREPELRDLLERADLVVAESAVVWAARMLGVQGVGAAWGVSLMDRLLTRGAESGWRVYFLGAREDVVRDLAERAARRWSGIRVVGWHHGYLDHDGEARVRDELRRARPDLLLLGMGSPRQERFMASLAADSGPVVSVGVGGSFDVHAGRKPDAPGWIRGSGVEWLYRAIFSPRLLWRYAVVNPWFVWAVLRERWTGRLPRPVR